MVAYHLAIFTSSFLLFLLQMMAGKIVLPFFGGVASVWTSLMIFFLLFLFLGYLYGLYLTKLKIETQKTVHLFFIFTVLALTVIQYLGNGEIISFSTLNQNNYINNPTTSLLLLVSLNIGPSFFLLSSTSTLIQHWFSLKFVNKSPYHLYSLSSLGSLIGLLSYPLIFEIYLNLKQQQLFWITLFCIFCIQFIRITFKITTETKSATTDTVGYAKISSWIILSTCSNLALISTTTHLSKSISSSPLIWSIPLSIFLVSFIISFSKSNWYSLNLHGTIFALLTTFLGLHKINTIKLNSENIYIILSLVTFFFLCLNINSILHLTRPPKQKLPTYYLCISFGGIVASFFCSTIATYFFKGYWEYQISLIFALLIILCFFWLHKKNLSQKVQFTILVILSLYTIHKSLIIPEKTNIYKARNFYGITVVEESTRNLSATISAQNQKIKTLVSGTISHGYQIFQGGQDFEPTTYYNRNSGIGIFIDSHIKRQTDKPLKIGVIGLGVGTLAGYCQDGDSYHFWEINPDIINIEKNHFTFLSHCKNIGGKIDVVLGDGRVQLEKEKSLQDFDLLVVDAFVDDAIPTHLLTQEAINLYINHLDDDGVIAFHITNRYLKLDLVLDSNVSKMDLYASKYENAESSWYFISKKQLFHQYLSFTKVNKEKVKPWTDSYSNLIPILKSL